MKKFGRTNKEEENTDTFDDIINKVTQGMFKQVRDEGHCNPFLFFVDSNNEVHPVPEKIGFGLLNASNDPDPEKRQHVRDVLGTFIYMMKEQKNKEVTHFCMATYGERIIIEGNKLAEKQEEIDNTTETISERIFKAIDPDGYDSREEMQEAKEELIETINKEFGKQVVSLDKAFVVHVEERDRYYQMRLDVIEDELSGEMVAAPEAKIEHESNKHEQRENYERNLKENALIGIFEEPQDEELKKRFSSN